MDGGIMRRHALTVSGCFAAVLLAAAVSCTTENTGGSGGSAGGPSYCGAYCQKVVAAACSAGPTEAACNQKCASDASAVPSSCRAAWDSIYTCATSSGATITCNASNQPAVAGCQSQIDSYMACTGGSGGSGGSAGGAGTAGTAGVAGTAGTAGTAGSAGTGGAGGSAGTDGGAGTAGTAGAAGNAGSDGGTCQPTNPNDPCDQCVAVNCCAEIKACEAKSSCAQAVVCFNSCEAGDWSACTVACMNPGDPAAVQFNDLVTCIYDPQNGKCGAKCT
jgi:hypothetical protein